MKDLLKTQLELLQKELITQHQLYIKQLSILRLQHKISLLSTLEKQDQIKMLDLSYKNIIDKVNNDIEEIKREIEKI